jgi:pyridoxine 5-phosphate synthase
MKLGVNIDHIATLREARKINDPSPLDAISVCKRARADQITIHLREDRRHIDDDDAKAIIQNSFLPVNLECGLSEEMINIACELKPNRITLVPEKREEVTTEGGLDLESHFDLIYRAVRHIKMCDIDVALFIDPIKKNIMSCKSAEVDMIEIHTGKYANLHLMLNSNLSRTKNSVEEYDVPRHRLKKMLNEEIDRITQMAQEASEFGITVAAGHGLNYHNVETIANIAHIEELNIGQSIIARSVFTGLEKAILDMKEIIG